MEGMEENENHSNMLANFTFEDLLIKFHHFQWHASAAKG